jgi:hypothetical protein
MLVLKITLIQTSEVHSWTARDNHEICAICYSFLEFKNQCHEHFRFATKIITKITLYKLSVNITEKFLNSTTNAKIKNAYTIMAHTHIHTHTLTS